MTHKKIILIDFDSTLHGYQSGWQGADVANDQPVPGAIEWLRTLLAHAEIDAQIYSARSRQEGGVLCMKNWLIKHGLEVELADAIKFPTEKPAAFVTIDDRAIRFTGHFDSLEPDDVLNFQPWNSKWPRWARYAFDEAAKWGMVVEEGSPPKRYEASAVVVKGEGGMSKKIVITHEYGLMHFSIIEPKVRGQIRVAALEFERKRAIADGRKPRRICPVHNCTHMPNEPLCEWELENR